MSDVDVTAARELVADFNAGRVSALVIAGLVPSLIERIVTLEDALTVTDSSRNTNHRRYKAIRALGRQPEETLAQWAARLDAIETKHFNDCRDCNYDYECVACAADGDGGHNCNCSYSKTDNGFGFFLRQQLKVLRAALKAGVQC